MPTRKIYDRKPAKTETERSGDEIALVIGTPMANAIGHRFDIPSLNGYRISEIELAANAAHKSSLVYCARFHQSKRIAGLPIWQLLSVPG